MTPLMQRRKGDRAWKGKEEEEEEEDKEEEGLEREVGIVVWDADEQMSKQKVDACLRI